MSTPDFDALALQILIERHTEKRDREEYLMEGAKLGMEEYTRRVAELDTKARDRRWLPRRGARTAA